MPYPKPKPRKVLNEGWYKGFIVTYGFDRNVTIRKGQVNETEVDFVRLGIVPVINENGLISDPSILKGDVMLWQSPEDGENWGYEQIVDVLEVEKPYVAVGEGLDPVPMLPDPDERFFINRPIAFEITHRVWKSRRGFEITSEQVTRYAKWDGLDSEGKTIPIPEEILVKVRETAQKALGVDEDEPPF